MPIRSGRDKILSHFRVNRRGISAQTRLHESRPTDLLRKVRRRISNCLLWNTVKCCHSVRQCFQLATNATELDERREFTSKLQPEISCNHSTSQGHLSVLYSFVQELFIVIKSRYIMMWQFGLFPDIQHNRTRLLLISPKLIDSRHFMVTKVEKIIIDNERFILFLKSLDD